MRKYRLLFATIYEQVHALLYVRGIALEISIAGINRDAVAVDLIHQYCHPAPRYFLAAAFVAVGLRRQQFHSGSAVPNIHSQFCCHKYIAMMFQEIVSFAAVFFVELVLNRAHLRPIVL